MCVILLEMHQYIEYSMTKSLQEYPGANHFGHIEWNIIFNSAI